MKNLEKLKGDVKEYNPTLVEYERVITRYKWELST